MRTETDYKNMIAAVVGEDPLRRERYFMDAHFKAGIHLIVDAVELMVTGIEYTEQELSDREAARLKTMLIEHFDVDDDPEFNQGSRTMTPAQMEEIKGLLGRVSESLCECGRDHLKDHMG